MARVQERVRRTLQGEVRVVHRLVGGKQREVRKPLLLRFAHRDTGGRSGGLKTDRQEYDLLVRVGFGVVDGVDRGVDHVDLRALRPCARQGHVRAGDFDQIAKGTQGAALFQREPDRLVDVPHRSDAHGAAGARDEPDVLRQHVADAEPEDVVGMRAADFHDADGRPVIVLDDLRRLLSRGLFDVTHESRSSSSFMMSSAWVSSSPVIFAMAMPACTMT